MTSPLWRPTTARIAVIYTLLAVVMTWPVAQAIGSRIAFDLGDPAFVCWILAWDAGQMIAAMHGDLAALAGYWNANIFYPSPLALAYSEHFTAQALQILPVYAATGNIILAYNLLFVSTFALSGLAVYLLVRDLTGRLLAAFLAGLAYAYAPYRMGQFSHLQVLTSYWMPLALYGLHRYFARAAVGARGRALVQPLAGSSVALLMQNLSCGYYMVFFAPFIGAYGAYELTQRRLWKNTRVLVELGLAGVVVAVATWPFVRPYLQVQELPGMGVRSIREVTALSADVQAFATATAGTHLWGERIRSYFKPEGEGFPGFTLLVLAVVGLVAGVRRAIGHVPWKRLGDAYAVVTALAGVLFVMSGGILVAFFVKGHVHVRLGGTVVVYSAIDPTLAVFVITGLLWFVLTGLARREERRASPTAFGYFALALLAAAFMALGPRIESFGRGLGTGPYLFFYEYVPGWQGLRVPARFLMLVMLFLSVLAGFGANVFLRSRFRRVAQAVIVLACACVLAEGWVAPVPTNLPVPPSEGLASPPDMRAGRSISPIYRVIRDLPGPIAVAEFPFGDFSYDLQAVFYAGYHRRPILNGYSGFVPPGYSHRAAYLADALTRPGEAADVLRESGATHALVHEWAYLDNRGVDVSRWLEGMGARLVTIDHDDALYVLPAAR